MHGFRTSRTKISVDRIRLSWTIDSTNQSIDVSNIGHTVFSVFFSDVGHEPSFKGHSRVFTRKVETILNGEK